MKVLLSRRVLITAAVAVAAVAFADAPPPPAPPDRSAAEGDPAPDPSAAAPGVDTTSALVRLRGEPLATSPNTRPPAGRKIDFSSPAVQAERVRLAALRTEFKSWLRQYAPATEVTREFDVALNALAVRLNGTPLATLRGAPQVAAAEYERIYRPLHNPSSGADPDLSLVHAVEAWQSAQVGGAANAGRGVKVGVIDSGIDHTHPCFGDTGFPATPQLGDQRFTNNKVIAARVFHTPTPGLTPEALQYHGSHVAGTVACNLGTPATVKGVDIPYDVSGVAPAAQLGNYNVFPGNVTNAGSADILAAMEAAYADGMDVINMSLGGSSSGAPDMLTEGVDNLDQANLVSAISAGNDGPGHYTVGSPGIAARGLTAGASTVGHFVGAPITVGSTEPTTVHGSVGAFPVVTSDLTAPLGVVPGATKGLGLACAPLPADSLTGRIAVVSRGSCAYSLKVRNVQNAGAVAAVVVSNMPGDPASMGQNPAVQPPPKIPAYQVALSAAPGLVAADGRPATIAAALTYVRTAEHDNIVAGFSSQGPTGPSAPRVKPDLVAPGAGVLSAFPVSDCGEGATDCWAFLQGTSMAAPHLAGMAAVVRGVHPDWTAEQVRSAIVNTADDGELTSTADGTTVETDVNIVGAGLGNLLDAVAAKVAVGPVSTSFGSVPGGWRKNQTSTVRLTDLTGSELTVSLAVDSVVGTGVTFSAPASVTVPAAGSVDVQVTATVEQGASPGDHSALLTLSAQGVEIAHTVVYVLIS